MKTKHLNPLQAAVLYGLFIILQSCTPTVPGSWKNGQISAGKRDDFHQLNTEVMGYLKANDPKGIKALCSKEMNAVNNEKLIEHISNRLNDNAYTLMDEYYVVHKFKDTDTVHSTGGSVNRYNVIYPYTAPEMYMAFFIPKKPDNKYLVSLVYSKLNYGWKITALDLAPYTINGKTAPELFNLAKDEYAKKEIQAALDNVSLAITCLKPGACFQYPDDADAKSFYTRITDEVSAKYHYPLVLKQVATGPMLLRVYNKNGDDGTYPLIYYMTHFNLKDTNEVKKENLQIRGVIAKIMPGLNDNNKYIFYSAFNKQPTGYVTVDHFDMMAKVR